MIIQKVKESPYKNWITKRMEFRVWGNTHPTPPEIKNPIEIILNDDNIQIIFNNKNRKLVIS